MLDFEISFVLCMFLSVCTRMSMQEGVDVFNQSFTEVKSTRSTYLPTNLP